VPSAPNFLANGIASGIAHATTLAHRSATLFDYNVAPIARLRLPRTDSSTNARTDRGTNRPADGKAHARANRCARSGVTGSVRIGAGHRRKGGKGRHSSHRQKQFLHRRLLLFALTCSRGNVPGAGRFRYTQ
jgi:hypothetical protein